VIVQTTSVESVVVEASGMKVLITGATGYIGGAVAWALQQAGHEVVGLARSNAAAAQLGARGFGFVIGDFEDPAGLSAAVEGMDALVSTASTGSVEASAQTFLRDHEAVSSLLQGMGESGKTAVFTSGSAVVGVLGRGESSSAIYGEDVSLPLRRSEFAPERALVPEPLIEGLGGAMAARVRTEQQVLNARGVRGMVVRPGLVYGRGGSYDIPNLIRRAASMECAPCLGVGLVSQSFVHIDDLARLFVAVLEHGRRGETYHAEAGEVRMSELARSVSRMVGAGDRFKSLSLEEMFACGGSAAISLSLNKRMSSLKTRDSLGWRPTRADILEDVSGGSYDRAWSKGMERSAGSRR